MMGERLRRLREAAGLTQAELAGRAGVSRQLVGAVEGGRQLPRVDAGLGLARALHISVESLFAPGAAEVTSVTGPPPGPGAAVRLGRVGERLVSAPVPVTGEGWGLADAVVGREGLELLPGARPGAVVVGCDPALGLAGRLVTEQRGPGLLTVSASTGAALDALAKGRAHGALVHGPRDGLPAPTAPVQRRHVAAWRVGLATLAGTAPGWERESLIGRRRVVQREAGAASQAALERAVTAAGGWLPDGPRAGSHLEAAQQACREGLVAVTIEPAALAAGLAFHPLEQHVCELWVSTALADDIGVAALGEVMESAGFHRRVAAIGGYDLTGSGRRVGP